MMKINSSSLLVNTPDVDECLAWTFDCEDDSQMCENTYGSYKCVCAEGLYWIDGQCKGEIHFKPLCLNKTIYNTKGAGLFLPTNLLTHLTRTLQEVSNENNIQTSLRYSKLHENNFFSSFFASQFLP